MRKSPFIPSCKSVNFIPIAVLLIGFLLSDNSILAQERAVIRIQDSYENVKNVLPESVEIISQSGKEVTLLYDEAYIQILKSQGYEASVLFTEAEMKQNTKGLRDAQYTNYAAMLQKLEQFAADYPDICTLVDLGPSTGQIYANQGYTAYDEYQHHIWGMKVSDNPEIEEDEPNSYIFGGHHAREPISVEVALYVLEHLLTEYENNGDIEDIVNETQIWFVPMVNPDGNKIVLDNLDVWWRKNIRDNNEDFLLNTNSNFSQDGVDLNRNYSFKWGLVGASNSFESILYHGPEAFSEVEIQYLRDLMDTRHFLAGISYHSFGELVLYPYGYHEEAVSPDLEALEDLGIQMAENIPAFIGDHYTPSQSWELYPAMGTLDDYSYGEHGTFAYTIELATMFIPQTTQIEIICEQNLEAALILLQRPFQNTVKGHITNAATGEAMVAKVEVLEIDNSGSFRKDYLSDSTFGTYYRLLSPGNYSMRFSAYGYQDTLVENVESIDNEAIILDIALKPIPEAMLGGTITNKESGAPIQGARIQLLGDHPAEAISDEMGIFEFPNLYAINYSIHIYAENYESVYTNIELSGGNNEVWYELDPFTAISFEEGIIPEGFSGGSIKEWFVSNDTAADGLYSMKSGDIGDLHQTKLFYTSPILQSGVLTFSYKVSSEYNGDKLMFYLDDRLMNEWSGEIPWKIAQYEVEEGSHSLMWVYMKNGQNSEGEDAAWIDRIIFPEDISTSIQSNDLETIDIYPNPAHHKLFIATETSIQSIAIYSMEGQKLSTNWSINGELDISNLAPGMYFIEINTEQERIIKTFITY